MLKLSSDYGILAYLLSRFHLLDFQGNWERVRNVVVPKWVMYIRVKVLFNDLIIHNAKTYYLVFLHFPKIYFKINL
jgi:hypothetical protein